MRMLLIGLAVAAIVYAVSGGHVIFLPLLFVPLAFFSFGRRRRRRSGFFR
jgi:hypothetical protein